MGLVTVTDDLLKWFEDRVTSKVDCEPETRAYIANLLLKQKVTAELISSPITLLYARARERAGFIHHQQLADWLFWTKSVAPQHLHHAVPAYYDAVAQFSYFACYRMVREWVLFEELSDRFSELTQQVGVQLSLSSR